MRFFQHSAVETSTVLCYIDFVPLGTRFFSRSFILNRVYIYFLQILKAALQGEKLTSMSNLPMDEWAQIMRLAQTHHVLPLVFEAVHALPEIQSAPFFGALRNQIRVQVLTQTQKTLDFQLLYQRFAAAGLQPLVVKGLVCRDLYPFPDHRISSDEDLLIMPDQTSAYHEILTQYGLSTSEVDISATYEIPYRKVGGPLYIELHRYLFPPESEAYGDLNRFFDSAFDRSVEETIQGFSVRTMSPTDHLFYLICHSFKHFLHSGFGVRQVCDIILYANAYGSRIDWALVLENCRAIRADRFAAALFAIGEKYLVFDPALACFPAEWRELATEERLRLAAGESALLLDLLAAGVYGDADMSRKHSSNITLDAVSAHKGGRRSGNALLLSLFPSAKKIEGRFPCLKKHPYLLPVAWLQRMLRYRKESRSDATNNAAESLKIGGQRVDMLREYGIID